MLLKECTVSLIPGLSERQQGKDIFFLQKEAIVFIYNMLLDDCLATSCALAKYLVLLEV